MGFIMGLKALTAAVLGGIGNAKGAVLGAFIVALSESFAAGYFFAAFGVLGAIVQGGMIRPIRSIALSLRMPDGLLPSSRRRPVTSLRRMDCSRRRPTPKCSA